MDTIEVRGEVRTVGKVEQAAVGGVHVTGCYVVPLGRPADAVIVLDVELLRIRHTDKVQPGFNP